MSQQFVVVSRAPSGIFMDASEQVAISRFPTEFGLIALSLRTRYVNLRNVTEPYPVGLFVEAVGEATNLDAAIGSFSSASGAAAALLTCAANAPTGEMETHIAFEVTPGADRRDFWQQALPEGRIPPTRGRRFPLAQGIEFIRCVASHERSDRLYRGIAHYGRALLHWLPGAEIIALNHIWIGFEALTKLARIREAERKGLSQEGLASEWRVGSIRDLDSEVRKRVLFRDDQDTYRVAREASDTYEHSFESFPQVQRKARSVRDKAASYLREAILDLSEVPSDVEQHLLAEPFSRPFPPHFSKYVRGELLGEGAPNHPEELYPRVRWLTTFSDSQRTAQGSPKVKFAEHISPLLGADVKLRVTSLAIAGLPPERMEGSTPAEMETEILTSGTRSDEDAVESGFRVNLPGASEWASTVGKFILNFAGLEMLADFWLYRLSGNTETPDSERSKPFRDRVHSILDLLDATGRAAPSAKRLWEKANKLSRMRDDVVRNPHVRGRLTTDEGSREVKMILRTSGSEPLELDRLREAVDETVELAQSLESALDGVLGSAGQYPLSSYAKNAGGLSASQGDEQTS